jgi:RNA polymerase sigma factor for flagellar operon FliA
MTRGGSSWPLGQSRHSQPDGTKDFKNMQGTGDSKAPDTRARDERIKAHLDLVKSIAREIRGRPLGRGMDLDDLAAYGAVGLVEAATRFEERGVPFAAFARQRIVGAILDGIRTQHWFGRRADRRLRIDRVGHEWQVALGAGAQARNDIRWSGRPMVCPSTETDDVNEQVSAALRGLPALERRLVEIHHYQEKTITEAAKELGICRPWTSRLHARALAALRAALKGNPLPLPPKRPNARLVLDRSDVVACGSAAHERPDATIAEGVAR